MVDFLAERREQRSVSLTTMAMLDPDSDHGYLAKLQRKIKGEPEPEAVEFRPRMDRAVGDRR
jgi:hypothetical protein